MAQADLETLSLRLKENKSIETQTPIQQSTNVSIQTNNLKLSQCDECEFAVSNKNDFESHMKNKHSRLYLAGKYQKVTLTKDLVIQEWSDENCEGHDIIMAYINMQRYSGHKCDECIDGFVRNTSKAKNPTGGWDLRFCTKFNFKFGDRWKEPPYIKTD